MYEIFLTLTVFAREDTSNELSIEYERYEYSKQVYSLYVNINSLFNMNITLILKNLLKHRMYEIFLTLTVFAREDTSNES